MMRPLALVLTAYCASAAEIPRAVIAETQKLEFHAATGLDRLSTFHEVR